MAYERAISLDINDSTSFANLGMYYLEVENAKNIAKQYFSKAVEIATNKGEQCPIGHLGLAAVAQKLGNKEEEIKYCEIAKQEFKSSALEDSTDYWALFGLGWCWASGDKNYDKAINYTKAAVELKPDFLIARYNLACMYSRKEMPKECMNYLKSIFLPIKKYLQDLFIESDPDFLYMKNIKEFKEFCKDLDINYTAQEYTSIKKFLD